MTIDTAHKIAELRGTPHFASAALLLSEHGENPEYDRGVLELLCDSAGLGIGQDDHEQVLAALREHREHDDRPPLAINQVVVAGTIDRIHRRDTGHTCLDVVVRTDGSTDSVPVITLDGGDVRRWQPVSRRLVVGSPVVVTGKVRQRFYRAGGATQSRTEVDADRIIHAHADRASTLIEIAAASLLGENNQ